MTDQNAKRDEYVMAEALAFTIEALNSLPIEHRPDNNISDMKRLLDDLVTNEPTLAIQQTIARKRLENVSRYLQKPR